MWMVIMRIITRRDRTAGRSVSNVGENCPTRREPQVEETEV